MASPQSVDLLPHETDSKNSNAANQDHTKDKALLDASVVRVKPTTERLKHPWSTMYRSRRPTQMLLAECCSRKFVGELYRSTSFAGFKAFSTDPCLPCACPIGLQERPRMCLERRTVILTINVLTEQADPPARGTTRRLCRYYFRCDGSLSLRQAPSFNPNGARGVVSHLTLVYQSSTVSIHVRACKMAVSPGCQKASLPHLRRYENVTTVLGRQARRISHLLRY